MSPVLAAALQKKNVSSSTQVPQRRAGRGPGGLDTPRTEGAPRFHDREDPGVHLRRRVLNLAVALPALILLLPLMALIALAVKLTSPGPAIYSQTRVGIDRRRPGSEDASGRRKLDYGGKLFTIYKFRTMAANPASTLQIWALPNDSRVTPLGRVLRKFRLDELPQLFNVIRGDMNIVGPRPEQPGIFLDLRDQIEGYPERQRVLPGITGWAQVNHHYGCCLDDVRTKLAYDLEYIRSQSVRRDLLILLRTVPVIVFQRGAW